MKLNPIAKATCVLLLIATLAGQRADADIVIRNTTAREVSYFVLVRNGTSWKTYRLKPGAGHAYRWSKPLVVRMPASGKNSQVHRLKQDRNYEFRIDPAGRPELRRVEGDRPSRNQPPGSRPVAESKRPDTADTPHAEARELKILALADQTYRQRFSHWEDRIPKIVAEASQHYERKFGLRFRVVEVRAWEYKAVSGLFGQLLVKLLDIAPGGQDIVVAFVAENDRTFKGSALVSREGRAPSFGQHAVVCDLRWPRTNADMILVHELGHLLGAFHVDDPQSIMQPDRGAVPIRFKFDPINSEIMRLTRNIDLHAGVTSLCEDTRNRIRDLFRQHRHPGEQLCDDPVTRGYLYLAARAQTRGNLVRSRDLLNTAIEMSPTNAGAHTSLGGIALSEGDGLEAERCFRRALELDKQDLNAQTGLATVSLDMADLEGASTTVRRVVMRQPNHTQARMVRAICRYLAGDSEGMVEDLVFLDRVSPPLARQVRTLTGDELVKRRFHAESAIRETAGKAKKVQNHLGMEFVPIAPTKVHEGRFQMGSPPTVRGRQSDERQYWVELTREYYLGVTEVTQGHFQQVMGRNPSRYSDRGPDHPVESVTWDEAVEFCERLSQRPEELKAGKKFRLPTEAEWEFACRAGTTGPFFFGEEPSWIADYAWIGGGTHPVARKAPNQWGLYDMLGNVWEWCSDWHGEYPEQEQVDPRGPKIGRRHVLRGGSWNALGGLPRTADRSYFTFGTKSNSTGFRVVCELVTTE